MYPRNHVHPHYGEIQAQGVEAVLVNKALSEKAYSVMIFLDSWAVVIVMTR
ncbi:hypothetical protein [Phytohalomonas tamaricis]|uniref:hypothetical protein n=1 Tax=Phytohalomonas tamaricis TaxID=2081032 RepID=UPI00131A2BDF|nr:hypothetical protein [Phytohalomonas tamaricis]